MIPLSTNSQQRWQPAWDDSPESPIFYFKSASLTERELFEAEAAGHRAAAVFPWDLQNQFFEGLKALLPDDPESIDRLTDVRQRMLDEDKPTKVGAPEKEKTVTTAERAEVDEVADALMQYWPGYRQLVEQAARREAVMPMLAVRRFMSGCENIVDGEGTPVEFRRGIDGLVPDKILELFPPVTIRAFGLHIYNALYARGTEKNLEPPLKSDEDQKTSGKAAAKPPRGKSAKTSGRKTQR